MVALLVSAVHWAARRTKDNVMTINILGRRSRIAAAAFLVAAGATVANLLGATAPANAADQYVVVAVGLANDNPPVVSIGGMAIGTDENQTGINAQTDCVNRGGQPVRQGGQCQEWVRRSSGHRLWPVCRGDRPSSCQRRKRRLEPVAEPTERAHRRVGLHESTAAATAKRASGPQARTDGLLGPGPGWFRGPHHGP